MTTVEDIRVEQDAQSAQHPITDAAAPGSSPGYAGHKPSQLARLQRIEGQVRGVRGMVQEDRYCMDVLTQISAVTRALQEVAVGLLDDHLRRCVLDAATSDPEAGEEKFVELNVALRRALRM